MAIQLSGSLAITGSLTTSTTIGAQGAINVTNATNPVSFTSTASLYSDGGVRFTKDMYVSGTAYFNNVTVFGTQSIAYISSSQLNIGTNLITVNTDTPTVRFGGLAVYDSGSTGLTGSILWDSEANHWVYSNPSGSSYSGGMFISGPRSAALGSEQGTTACMVLVGQGGDHLTSSAIYHSTTATCIPNTLIGSTICTTMTNASCIGIGTTTPSYKLDVDGDLRTTQTAIIGNGAAQTELQINSLGGADKGPFIRFQKAGAAKGYIGAYSAIINGTSDDLTYYAVCSQQWMTNNSTSIKMLLDSSGNLTVGSADAGNAGTINVSVGAAGTTAGGLQLWAASNQTHYLQFGDGTTGGQPYAGYVSYAHGTDSLAFGTATATRAIISSTGIACFSNTVCAPNATIANCLGVGVTSPQGNFEAVGLSYFTRTNNSLLINPNYGGANTHAQLQVVCNMALAFATNGDNERMRISPGGITCFSNAVCAPFFSAGDGIQCNADDAPITIKRGVGFAGLDFKSLRTSGNIGGARFHDCAGTVQAQLLVEVDGSFNFYNATSNNRLKITSTGIACFACQVCALNFITPGITNSTSAVCSNYMKVFCDTSDTRYLQMYMGNPSTYNPAPDSTVCKIVSGIEFNWYSENWKIGATRGGGADICNFVIGRNNATQMVLTVDSKLGICTTTPATRIGLNSYVGSRLPYINGTGNTFDANGITVGNSNNGNTNIGGGIDFTNNCYCIGAYSPILSFSSISSNYSFNNAYAGIWGVLRGSGVDANWVVGDLVLGTGGGAGIVERMRISCNGNVGINTTSPVSLLDVQGPSGATGCVLFTIQKAGGYGSTDFFQYYNSTSDYGINFGLAVSSATNGRAGIIIRSDTSGNGTLVFNTTSTERMRITSNGYVGIGTTSPNISGGLSGNAILTMKATTNSRVAILELNGCRDSDGDNNSYIMAFNNSCTSPFGVIRFNRGTVDGCGSITLSTSGTDRMLISACGNVGIGTTSLSTEANLFLGAQGTTEGGQLVLQKATSYQCASHIDNYSNQFRILSGTDTATTAAHMIIDHTTKNACFYGTVSAPQFRTTGLYAGIYCDVPTACSGYVQYDMVNTANGNLYQLYVTTNPNPGGSSTYMDYYYGKIIIGNGYDGANLKTYMTYCPESILPRSLYGSGGGNVAVCVCLVQGGSEYTCVNTGTNYCVRVKIGGNGNYTAVNLVKLL